MYNHLTNKEKKVKRIEARKRAILWSERELRRRQLHTQNKVETISIRERRQLPKSIPSEVSTIISQQPKEGAVSSLQQAIQDLQVQRQELDTTIKVLTKYLNQLTANSKPPALKKRSKPDGV